MAFNAAPRLTTPITDAPVNPQRYFLAMSYTDMPDKEIQETEFLEAADPVQQKALVRKLDWHIIPTIATMYTLAFLDRGKKQTILGHNALH